MFYLQASENSFALTFGRINTQIGHLADGLGNLRLLPASPRCQERYRCHSLQISHGCNSPHAWRSHLESPQPCLYVDALDPCCQLNTYTCPRLAPLSPSTTRLWGSGCSTGEQHPVKILLHESGCLREIKGVTKLLPIQHSIPVRVLNSDQTPSQLYQTLYWFPNLKLQYQAVE